MPNLPTIAVNNQVVYDRLVAAFNSDPDEYREWLKMALRKEVYNREQLALQAEANEATQLQMQELNSLIQTEWPTPAP